MHQPGVPQLILAGAVSAVLKVDLGSISSIKAATRDVAFDLMSFYKGNRTGEILGLLDEPISKGYPWWTNAIVWSTMIDYWRYTGDESHNTVTAEGLIAQSGSDLQHAFLPRNWTDNMANDEQGFWAMAAMQAAELGLPSPTADAPAWVDLAKAVFDMQAARYSAEDEGNCHGGLHWKLLPESRGYDTKNTMSTAVFLNLGARLYRFTGNKTYAKWVEKGWDWLTSVGLIEDDFKVYDSVWLGNGVNCSDINRLQFSYAPAVLLEAAAYMSNQTSNDATRERWSARVRSVTNKAISFFFRNGTLVETACEPSGTCYAEMFWFKGIMLRSLANAVRLTPSLLQQPSGEEEEGSAGSVAATLHTTARSAAETCAGGLRGRECVFGWVGPAEHDNDDDDDKTPTQPERITGPPAEANALAALLAVLTEQEEGLAPGRAGDFPDGGGRG